MSENTQKENQETILENQETQENQETAKVEKKEKKIFQKKEKKSKTEELEAKIAELEEKVAKDKDDYIRLMAEFDNYRRRTSQEKLEIVSMASVETIKGLLPVLDDCERALKVLLESDDSDAAKEGTELIYSKLMTYLKSKGLAALMRSSVDTAKDALAQKFEAVFSLAGIETAFAGGYSGWAPNPESAILATMKKVYNDLYGKEPAVMAIHAGLECGILGGTYPNWDMVSCGPTLMSPHSPDERANIPSVAKCWEFLKAVLENIPVR